jgi:beta-glucanase (GH16 family)
MAFVSQGQWANSQNKTAGTTLVFNANATAPVGSFIVLVIAKDNAATANGQTSEVTGISSNTGNTWTKAQEYTQAQGSAGAGATCAVWFCNVTTQIANGASFTINFAQSITAKTCSAWLYTMDSNMVGAVASTAVLGNAGADPGSMAISGLASANYLFVRGIALEYSSFDMIETSGFTPFGTDCTSGGTTDTNMSVAGEWKIATATGATSDPTLSAVDNASVFVAFKMNSTGGSTPPPSSSTKILSIAPPTPGSGQYIQALVKSARSFSGDIHYQGRIVTARQTRTSGGDFYEVASPIWHLNAFQSYNTINIFTNGWELNRFSSGNATQLAKGDGSYPIGQWVDFDITQTGNNIVVKLNGFTVADINDPNAYTAGAVGMIVQDAEGQLDNIAYPFADDFESYAEQSLADKATIGNWTIDYLNGGSAAIKTVSTSGTSSTPNASVMDIYGSDFVWGTTSGSAGGRTAPTTANHLYVATNGSDSNAGTQAAPFLTIGKAASVAQPNTTIHIADGTYAITNLSTTCSGTSSGYIYFWATNKWGPKLVPTGTGVSGIAWNVGGNYNWVDGIEIDGQSKANWDIGFWIDGSNVVIKYAHTHHIGMANGCTANGGGGICASGFSGQGFQDVLNCVSHHIGPGAIGSCAAFHGYYMQGHDWTLKNCIAHNCTGNGINSHHDSIRGKIINNTIFRTGRGIICSADQFYNITQGGSYTIENNIVYDNNPDGSNYTGGIGIAGTTDSNSVINNNYVGGNQGQAILITSAQGTASNNITTGLPGFVSYAIDGTGNYHLAAGSQCIDFGLPDYVNSDDLDGATRIVGAKPDLGVYEYGAAAPSGQPANPTWPATFDADLTAYTVRNEGVQNNDTTKALNGSDGVHPAWSQQMSKTTAGIIGLMFGYEEAKAGTSATTFKNNLQQMINGAKSYGKTVILFTEHKVNINTSAYNQAIVDLGSSNSLQVIDIFTWSNSHFTGALTDWLPDGVYPKQTTYNDIGHYASSQISSTAPSGGGTGTVSPVGQNATDWVLTFQDEFDGTAMDFTRWNDGIWFRRAPGTKVNYAVQNGSLFIYPLQDQASADKIGMDPASNGYYERDFATDGKFSQTYGYFEAEIKMPTGRGLFPAFWLFNHDTDPLDTEIDIMEAYPGGYDNNQAAFNWASSQLHAIDYIFTVWNDTGDDRAGYMRMAGGTNSRFPTKDLSTTYNVFGVKWDSSGITPYFNGQALGVYNESANVYADTLVSPSLNTNNFASRPMYFVLSLWLGRAVGNESPWPNTSETPQGIGNPMEVRYVRAWRFQAGSGGGSQSGPAMANQYHTGLHSHRSWGGGSPNPSFKFGLFRDWDCDGTADMYIWKSDNTIDFSRVDTVYQAVVNQGGKVIKNFGSVPTWAARVKTVSDVNDFSLQGSSRYGVVGSMSGPADLDAYEDYCFRFITHTKNWLFAVEGWNEPFDTDDQSPYEYFTGTKTQLADIQQRLYRAAKRVDPNLPVFSPPNAWETGIRDVILTAHCSDGTPMYNYYDVLGCHPYDYSAAGEGGMQLLSDLVNNMRSWMNDAGTNKPIADTEHGFFHDLHPGGSYFCDSSQDVKAQILYDLNQKAKQLGLVTICFYSFDDGLVEGNADFSPGTPCATKMQQAYDDFDTKSYPWPVVSSSAPPPTGGSGGGGSTTGPGDMPYGRPASEFGKMTFRDEFDLSTLNANAWTTHIWYQGEQGVPYDIANSCLRIYPDSSFVDRHITTDSKFEQKYGYWEWKAKLPIGKGVWPALWLYYHNDSAAAPVRREVDVMEAYPGGGPNSGWSDSSLHPTNFAATLHEANADYSSDVVPFTEKLSDSGLATTDLSAQFHYYGVKITQSRVEFYFDGQLLGGWDNDGVFTVFQYIIMSLQFGSASGTPDGTTPLGTSNAFQIDYVRVWALADGSTQVNTQLPAPDNGSGSTTTRTATLSKTLRAMTLSSAGTSGSAGGAARIGNLSITLGPLTLDAGSQVPQARNAVLNKTLRDMTLASTATNAAGGGGGGGGGAGSDDDAFLIF